MKKPTALGAISGAVAGLAPEHEAVGLDLSQHGEEGYDFNT
jgi:ammonia channel protein AmtB